MFRSVLSRCSGHRHPPVMKTESSALPQDPNTERAMSSRCCRKPRSSSDPDDCGSSLDPWRSAFCVLTSSFVSSTPTGRVSDVVISWCFRRRLDASISPIVDRQVPSIAMDCGQLAGCSVPRERNYAIAVDGVIASRWRLDGFCYLLVRFTLRYLLTYLR